MRKLTIFTDASLLGKVDKNNGNRVCAGAIAVSNGTRECELHSILERATNNQGELTALSLAMIIADRYKNRYDTFDIFSDSLISVKGLREWLYTWIRTSRDGILRSTTGEVKNQDIILRIANFIVCRFDHTKSINIYHCNGHIYTKRDYRKALRNLCMNFNYISDAGIEYLKSNLQHIQRWNNYIDESTRASLTRPQYGVEYIYDALKYDYAFNDNPIFDLLGHYENVVGRNFVI